MENKPNYYAIIPSNVRYDKRLKANEKLLYGEITSLSNKTGVCFASNDYFANLYCVDKCTISRWIKNLIDCGYLTSKIEYKNNTKEIINRYLLLNQYPIDEKVNTPIDEKVKDNNTSINNTSINSNMSEFFNIFYQAYPLKKSKEYAKKAFLKIKPDEAMFEKIMQGVEKYKKHIKCDSVEQRYIKHPSTWLNQGCWDDEYDASFKTRCYNPVEDDIRLQR